MSYSLTVTAPRKSAAKVAVAAELVKAAKGQTCHERDLLQAQAAANAFIVLLPDDETRLVRVTMSGSLSGQWSGTDIVEISAANVSITAALVPLES